MSASLKVKKEKGKKMCLLIFSELVCSIIVESWKKIYPYRNFFTANYEGTVCTVRLCLLYRPGKKTVKKAAKIILWVLLCYDFFDCSMYRNLRNAQFFKFFGIWASKIQQFSLVGMYIIFLILDDKKKILKYGLDFGFNF